MPSPVAGDPLSAVLVPPQLARFRAITGSEGEPLTVVVTGWNKYVLLGTDTAFLFPRHAVNVEWFERELAVCRYLEPTGLTIVPRVIERWHDEKVWPYPFAAVTRLPGTHPVAAATGLLAELGRAIAQWHGLAPLDLPGARPPSHHARADLRWLRRALDPTMTRDAAGEAATRLGRPDRLERWTELLAAAARHPSVLVHGDIHEDQLLSVDGRLSGILDWETARVDHPFWDFDLGEWGTGLWRRRRHDFSELWAVMWRAYAEGRGLDTDAAPLETAFRLRQALYLLDNERDPAVVGTLAEHLAAI